MKHDEPRFRGGLMALIATLGCLAPAGEGSAQPERATVKDTPPWKRQLTGDDAKQVESLNKKIEQLKGAGQFVQAVEPAKQALTICQRACGPDNWQTSDARRAVDDSRKIAALPEAGRQAMATVGELESKARGALESARNDEAERLYRSLLEIRRRWVGDGHPDTAVTYNDIAVSLDQQGKYAGSEPLLRKALAIHVLALGEGHPHTANSYSNLSSNLAAQGKYAEAEPLARKALAIKLAVLGDHNLETAVCYHEFACAMGDQGKYSEAEPLYRKAMAICLDSPGDDQLDAAMIYNGFAANLFWQGKFAVAEPLVRRALAIWLRVLGDDHPNTALGYNHLANNQSHQGKYAEAEQYIRKTLAIRKKALGEDHPDTGFTYNDLAACLARQGRYEESEAFFRKALAIRLEALGENHPVIASSYLRIASSLYYQGKYDQAERLFRKALAICLKVLGEDHPDTGTSYNKLARFLDSQDKFAEAEPLHRKALAIRLKILGERHADTAITYNDLASNLDCQGKLDEAISSWTAAAAIYEQARGASGASGLERSLTSQSSPLPALAISLARCGRAREAWSRWESNLAHGLLDDLSARLLRPLTLDERRREADLARQLQRLDERTARLAAKSKRTESEDKQLDALRREGSILRGRWVELKMTLDQKYQAYAGKPSTLEEVQKALAGDAALAGWLDVKRHHWACVVRRTGDPNWVQVPGSGKDGSWTKENNESPGKLRDALAGHQPEWAAQAGALAQRRLAPLMPHLEGVKHLIVLPSEALVGVPIETLIAALPADSPSPVVSYAPSGSMLARLSAPRSLAPAPLRLLALGDPAFPNPADTEPAPTPPDHGMMVGSVVPNGNADVCGIKAGDVLMEYNGKKLKSRSDLAVVSAGGKAIRVPVKLWRDGEVRSLDIAAGPLGIQSKSNQPAAQVILAQRAAADILKPGMRGENLTSLPGTRREVQAIAALFPEDQVTTLLGSQATESTLQGLAQTGALKGYRYIHLATHGKFNPNVALSSAVFLAAEPERPTELTDSAALESAPDCQVTAEQIVRTWDLDADLVVLSACESALGRYAGGEGYLGFAQALFVKGARSLVLSLWRVDDKATSLLMTRFYQNLLGKRPAMSKPMPKVEALAEAKQWLRSLTGDQIDGELALLLRGDVRPLVKVDGTTPPGLPTSPKTSGIRPYDHPYFWAAFVLVGDPD